MMTTSVPITGPSTVMSEKMPAVCAPPKAPMLIALVAIVKLYRGREGRTARRAGVGGRGGAVGRVGSVGSVVERRSSACAAIAGRKSEGLARGSGDCDGEGAIVNR
jgi:hypothetical protein